MFPLLKKFPFFKNVSLFSKMLPFFQKCVPFSKSQSFSQIFPKEPDIFLPLRLFTHWPYSSQDCFLNFSCFFYPAVTDLCIVHFVFFTAKYAENSVFRILWETEKIKKNIMLYKFGKLAGLKVFHYIFPFSRSHLV